MRMNQRELKLPEPGQVTPWHPETILDIQAVHSWDLPVVEDEFLGLSDGRWKATGSAFSGSEDFMRGQMEVEFLRFPAVGFMVNGGYVQVYHYTSRTTDELFEGSLHA